MKKSFVLISIFFGLISCSKLPDNDFTHEADYLTESDNVPITLFRDPKVQDSLDKIFLAKYLDYTPLTPFELDSIAKNQTPGSAKSIATIIYEESPEYTDWSGWIHLKVFFSQTTSEGHSQYLSVILPSDWVLVGGGAMTWDFDPYSENGAFINNVKTNGKSYCMGR